MAHAVADAVETGEHLLVQAGTGTGKSLAYLVPAVRHAMESGKPAVVATATLALQAQIVDRDMPRVASALAAAARAATDVRAGQGSTQLPVRAQARGRVPRRGRRAPRGRPGERDGVAAGRRGGAAAGVVGHDGVGGPRRAGPRRSDRAWRQVSVSAHECLGGKCPVIAECFVERSRDAAKDVDVVVTNHSFMAIDAFENRQMLPEHDVLVIDEAHELVDRVTATITDEVSSGMVTSAARKAAKLADGTGRGDRRGGPARGGPRRGRGGSDRLAVRRVGPGADARAGHGPGGPVGSSSRDRGSRPTEHVRWLGRRSTRCTRTRRGSSNGAKLDVLWLRRDPRRGPVLNVAPMSVAMLVRDRVFAERTCVLTSRRWSWADRSTPWRGRSGCAARAHPPGAASTWGARSTTSGRPSSTSRATSPPRAVTGPRRRCSTRSRPWSGRPAVGRSGCSRRPGGAERGGAAAGAVLVGRHCNPDPVPGRGPDLDTRAAVREGAGDVPVRDAHAVAGRRRAGFVVPARRHRPDPVPAPGRPSGRRPGPRPSRGWA